MKGVDLPEIKTIIDENHMFPSELLDDMSSGYLSGEASELWFVSESLVGQDREINAVAFCAPEQMTHGTWNLLLIAVRKDLQGTGLGSRMMAFVEQALEKRKARILLVETSGLPEYAMTRLFYPKCGYKQVAVIPDYYDKGDDKVVFWKSLAS